MEILSERAGCLLARGKYKELLPHLTEGTPLWEKVYLATRGVTDLRGLGLGVWRGNTELTKEEITEALIPPKPKPKTRLQKEAEAFAHIEEFGYTGTYPTYEKKHRKMMGVKTAGTKGVKK